MFWALTDICICFNLYYYSLQHHFSMYNARYWTLARSLTSSKKCQKFITWWMTPKDSAYMLLSSSVLKAISILQLFRGISTKSAFVLSSAAYMIMHSKTIPTIQPNHNWWTPETTSSSRLPSISEVHYHRRSRYGGSNRLNCCRFGGCRSRCILPCISEVHDKWRWCRYSCAGT